MALLITASIQFAASIEPSCGGMLKNIKCIEHPPCDVGQKANPGNSSCVARGHRNQDTATQQKPRLDFPGALGRPETDVHFLCTSLGFSHPKWHVRVSTAIHTSNPLQTQHPLRMIFESHTARGVPSVTVCLCAAVFEPAHAGEDVDESTPLPSVGVKPFR